MYKYAIAYQPTWLPIPRLLRFLQNAPHPLVLGQDGTLKSCPNYMTPITAGGWTQSWIFRVISCNNRIGAQFELLVPQIEKMDIWEPEMPYSGMNLWKETTEAQVHVTQERENYQLPRG